MSPDNIMRSDLLDILFENRNKEYGAYMLRKTYGKRLQIALLSVGVLVCILSILIQFRPKKNHMLTGPVIYIDSLQSVTPPEKKEEPKPQQKPQQKEQVASRDYQSIKVVPDDQVTDTIADSDILEKVVISNVNSDGDSTMNRVITETQKLPVEEPQLKVAVPEPEIRQIFEYVEKMPSFPGGVEGLKKYILKNVLQPDDLEEGQKLVVVARFVVKDDGSIDEASITKTGRADLDKEVLRVIRKMPRWQPGMQNGKQVSVWFQLPVTFVSEY